jgi:hypothetical protein
MDDLEQMEDRSISLEEGLDDLSKGLDRNSILTYIMISLLIVVIALILCTSRKGKSRSIHNME